MSNGPPFLPPEVATLNKVCPECGVRVRPDLWKLHDEPFTPIYSNADPLGKTGAWIQQSSIETCECGCKVSFELNPRKLEHGVYFYGDDADRKLGKYKLHVYSMIGGTTGPTRDIVREVRLLKQSYVSDRNPDDWRIHATKMMSGQQRLNHGIYKKFDGVTALSFFKECAGILKAHDQYTWNTLVMGVILEKGGRKEKRKVNNELKITVHNALLSYTIYAATKQSLRPIFQMDASKPIKRYPHIEGWSHGSYLGTRHYLGHAFLTHSNDILPPEFVQPGSHPCLELADVHAYFAARSIYKQYSKEEPEIPLPEFGNFRYLWIKDGSTFEHVIGDEIPSKWFPRTTFDPTLIIQQYNCQ